MLLFNALVILMVSAYAVNGRPTETSKITSSSGSVVENQGWNESQRPTPNIHPVSQTVASTADSIPNGSSSTGSSSSLPSNVNHDVFSNQVDFAGADAHRALASLFGIPSSGFLANPVENQVAGFVPRGFRAGSGVSASATAVSISS
ncbi:Uncharacterized protein APZ42_018222 [Daphnia magna]|uniref:Secreted protein n=1 Tax=Daphnia magna TaxID=35525 RepID=A0A164Z8Y7_9CRUS|nr:Uncharacterized protein APZ42_018222 [Daphnia magna]